MSTRTITLSTTQIQALKQQLHDATICKTPPYAHYQIKTSECVITAYQSGIVVFQGNGADYYADALETKTTSPTTKKTLSQYPQCGSDEVGTGDYFGPVVVTASYVTQEDIEWLSPLGIQDSKAIDDEKIRQLGPILMEKLPHSLLILNNQKYNQIHKTNNMNAIKAKLHNQAYLHLEKKLTTLPEFCIIDQFTPKTSYFKYLQKEPNVIRQLHFETKAESKYMSVACSSIIARYVFLLSFDAMQQRYDFSFPKGAGKQVDNSIIKFVQQFGKKELENVAKLHFANTQKAGI